METLRQKMLVQQSHTVLVNIKKDNLIGLIEGLVGLSFPPSRESPPPSVMNNLEELSLQIRNASSNERRNEIAKNNSIVTAFKSVKVSSRTYHQEVAYVKN